MVAWNDEMTSINPGEEKLYEYKAQYAGVWMYHCGTAPALHHIANGMYGMMIVEPKGGLDPVDQEFALVQSEWYLGGQGEPASLTKASAAAPAPDFVVFNGIANQYSDNPIQVETGKRSGIHPRCGPSVDSSFHVVGTIFDRVIKEASSSRSAMPAAGAARPSTCRRRRAAMVDSRWPRRPVSDRHPQRSISSGAARRVFQPETATRRTRRTLPVPAGGRHPGGRRRLHVRRGAGRAAAQPAVRPRLSGGATRDVRLRARATATPPLLEPPEVVEEMGAVGLELRGSGPHRCVVGDPHRDHGAAIGDRPLVDQEVRQLVHEQELEHADHP